MVGPLASRLLDVREVFGRLDKKKCGDLLEPGIDEIAAGVANLPPESTRGWPWALCSNHAAARGRFRELAGVAARRRRPEVLRKSTAT